MWCGIVLKDAKVLGHSLEFTGNVGIYILDLIFPSDEVLQSSQGFRRGLVATWIDRAIAGSDIEQIEGGVSTVPGTLSLFEEMISGNMIAELRGPILLGNLRLLGMRLSHLGASTHGAVRILWEMSGLVRDGTSNLF